MKNFLLKSFIVLTGLTLCLWIFASINQITNRDQTDIVTNEPVSYFTNLESQTDSGIADNSDKESSELEPVQLVRVIDGDTILVRNNKNEEIRVRMIGIDTPESVHPDESKNSQEGIVASDYTKDFLSSYETVYLQYDVERYDIYDRTLAYVWLRNDVDITNANDVISYMYNAILVINGYAEPKTYPPNILYSDLFFSLKEAG